MTFHARGKLLLSSEYLVLDGALALAIPTLLGQQMKVRSSNHSYSGWQAIDHEGNTWLSAEFDWPHPGIRTSSDPEAAQRLIQIFEAIDHLRPGFLQEVGPSQFQTRLEFPREWGLGTSSTLISMMAEWAEIDPFSLLKSTFGGSGYDLACARASGPLFYRLKQGQAQWLEVPFQPPFKDQLYFVYLGKKQNSREGIRHYREKQAGKDPKLIERFTELSWGMARSSMLTDFMDLVREHEEILSSILELPRAKDLFFQGYPGEIKSLGAWGGDFVMATGLESEAATLHFFQEKGFSTILRADQLLLW